MASGTRAETVSTWPTGNTAQGRVSGLFHKDAEEGAVDTSA